MLEYSKPVLKPSQGGLLFPPLVHREGARVVNVSPPPHPRRPETGPSRKFVKALYSSEGNDFGLRKETHGFPLTASNSVMPAAFLSLGLALMKGDFDERGGWPLGREGCRETPLSGRCSSESISALSLPHIPEKHHRLCRKSPQGLIYLPEWLSMGWVLREAALGGQTSSHIRLPSLSQSLLGLVCLKANSCPFFLLLLLLFKFF